MAFYNAISGKQHLLINNAFLKKKVSLLCKDFQLNAKFITKHFRDKIIKKNLLTTSNIHFFANTIVNNQFTFKLMFKQFMFQGNEESVFSNPSTKLKVSQKEKGWVNDYTYHGIEQDNSSISFYALRIEKGNEYQIDEHLSHFYYPLPF